MTPMGSIVTSDELVGLADEGQLVVEFQPVLSIQSPSRRRPILEALLRWDHPTRGRLSPADFLGAARTPEVRCGITALVLERAAAACAAWVERGWDVGVAVNIWPSDLMNEAVRAAIDDVLGTGLTADRLTIEVTERACNLDDASLVAGLISLARLGVRLSLDDFGTGDSTLARLRRVHFDEVKVDRMFVTDAAVDPTDRAILVFSVQLAHALGMDAVAEGIETPAALAMAREAGADGGQGFLFARPACFAEVVPPFDLSVDSA